ncbi:MAG: putative membrane protein [Cenarchaeum symbiont of Oopsacas minuta]|nr:putative membrane protein [Cenarchaeum symbiont of Oopsacas minuta]
MYAEFDSDCTPEIAYKKIIKQSRHGDFEITSSMKNEQIVFKGNRNYSVGVLVTLIVVGLLLFIVGLVIAAIYYWTRPYKKIIIELEPNDDGSIITVRSDGKVHNIVIYEFKKLLESKTK